MDSLEKYKETLLSNTESSCIASDFQYISKPDHEHENKVWNTLTRNIWVIIMTFMSKVVLCYCVVCLKIFEIAAFKLKILIQPISIWPQD